MSGNAGDRDRHSRSRLFPGLGDEGMARIRRSSFAIVGVGAVGAAAAEMAVRAGVPRLTLIDRDVVEPSNLSRQLLFDERDAEAMTPKAVAAARRLSEIDRSAEIRGVVADLSHGNALDLLAANGVLVDASDNFETRLLVSDAARFLGAISVYAACVGEEGLVSVSMPGSPCLRCYLEELPAAGSGPTCETAGVVPTLPLTVAGIAMTEALRAVAGAPVSGGVLAREAPLRAGPSVAPMPRVPGRPSGAPVPGARGGGCVGSREALRPASRPGRSRLPRAAGPRRPRAAAESGRASPPVGAPALRGRRGRVAHDLLGRTVRRPRDGRPAPGTVALRAVRGALT